MTEWLITAVVIYFVFFALDKIFRRATPKYTAVDRQDYIDIQWARGMRDKMFDYAQDHGLKYEDIVLLMAAKEDEVNIIPKGYLPSVNGQDNVVPFPGTRK